MQGGNGKQRTLFFRRSFSCLAFCRALPRVVLVLLVILSFCRMPACHPHEHLTAETGCALAQAGRHSYQDAHR